MLDQEGQRRGRGERLRAGAFVFANEADNRRFGLDLAGSFTLTVFHGGEADTLELKGEELNGGWNLLGRFQFEEGEETRVELSDRAGGRLYADAMRWRYVDPDNPEEAYEEELTSFGNFGRGRGGRPGGGPGGGRPPPPSPPGGSWLSRFW